MCNHNLVCFCKWDECWCPKIASLWNSSLFIWAIVIKSVLSSFFSVNRRLCEGVCGIYTPRGEVIGTPPSHGSVLPKSYKEGPAPLHGECLSLKSGLSSLHMLIDVPIHVFLISFHFAISSNSFILFSFPVKLLNSLSMEHITMGKRKFIYITSSSGNGSNP